MKKPTPATRALALCQALPRVYPDAHCELTFSNPLELEAQPTQQSADGNAACAPAQSIKEQDRWA